MLRERGTHTVYRKRTKLYLRPLTFFCFLITHDVKHVLTILGEKKPIHFKIERSVNTEPLTNSASTKTIYINY